VNRLRFSDFRRDVQLRFFMSGDRYVIAKARRVPKFSDELFSVIRDEKEITVIAKEGIELQSLSEKRFFKRITFDVTLPFELTGFLSHVSTLLANEDIPVFLISGYSTDHLFVGEEDSHKAIEILERDGMECSSPEAP